MTITTGKDAGNQEEKQQAGSNSEEGSIAISEANEDVQDAIEAPATGPQALRYENWLAKTWAILNWMPQRCRYDSENPPSFTLGMNILLGFVRLTFQ